MEKRVFERYSIFQTGGKQYQAIDGQTIAIEKLNAAIGSVVTFDEVLLRREANDKISIGQPFLNTPVTATVIRQDRDKKVIVFKFKRRKKSRVKNGHRQPFTVVRIESI